METRYRINKNKVERINVTRFAKKGYWFYKHNEQSDCRIKFDVENLYLTEQGAKIALRSRVEKEVKNQIYLAEKHVSNVSHEIEILRSIGKLTVGAERRLDFARVTLEKVKKKGIERLAKLSS